MLPYVTMIMAYIHGSHRSLLTSAAGTPCTRSRKAVKTPGPGQANGPRCQDVAQHPGVLSQGVLKEDLKGESMENCRKISENDGKTMGK